MLTPLTSTISFLTALSLPVFLQLECHVPNGYQLVGHDYRLLQQFALASSRLAPFLCVAEMRPQHGGHRQQHRPLQHRPGKASKYSVSSKAIWRLDLSHLTFTFSFFLFLQGPLSSEIKFECPVNSNCQVLCDYAKVKATVPGATFEPIQRILQAWKPKEDFFG